MEALSSATPTQRVSLYVLAKLAETLADVLEPGAIEASAEGHWYGYADILEQNVRSLDFEKSAQEAAWSLAAAIDKIIPPKGAIV
jgi:hypothetical protein